MSVRAFIYFPLNSPQSARSVERQIAEFRESGVRIIDETSIHKGTTSMIIFRYADDQKSPCYGSAR